MKGKDVCYHHGGKTPITHGLRSKYRGARLGDKIQELVDDPDLTNITLQIAALIAHQQNLMDMYERSGTWGLGGFAAFQSITTDIIKAIERYHKVTEGSRYTIRIEHIQVVINQIVKVADETIHDPADRQRFLRGLGELTLPSNAGVGAGAN